MTNKMISGASEHGQMSDGLANQTASVIPLSRSSVLSGVTFEPLLDRQFPLGPHRLHDTGRPDIRHVSTDDLTHTPHIRNEIIRQIEGARTKIFFCSFLFADDAIVNALSEASERLRGGVYILTALDKHLRADVLELDVDLDANALKHEERARRHAEHLRKLAHAGAWLRSAEDCHAKFCVIDDKTAVVTSANATPEAYESNPEDGLAFHDERVAHEFGRLFAHVWGHLTTLESTPGERLNVHSRQRTAPPPWRALAHHEPVRPVATLRRAESSLQTAAIDIIDRAQRHLAIATYSFMAIEHHPVGAALQRALARGVSIDLLVQPRNHVEAQRQALAWLFGLAGGRLQLFGHRRTHTKSIVADREVVLLWTGNLDGRHGWADGIEVGVVVNDTAVAKAVSNWTGDVMARATHTASASTAPTSEPITPNATATPSKAEILGTRS